MSGRRYSFVRRRSLAKPIGTLRGAPLIKNLSNDDQSVLMTARLIQGWGWSDKARP
jgi:hypothetical protein